MVNESKLKKKLPGLNIDGPVYGDNPEYQRKIRTYRNFQKKQPGIFYNLLHSASLAIDELDRAAEEAGFQQVYIENGTLKKKWKYRTN